MTTDNAEEPPGMKVYIDTDERYPDYIVNMEPDNYQTWGMIEVDEATVQRWLDAVAEYDRVQNEIEVAVKAKRARGQA